MCARAGLGRVGAAACARGERLQRAAPRRKASRDRCPGLRKLLVHVMVDVCTGPSLTTRRKSCGCRALIFYWAKFFANAAARAGSGRRAAAGAARGVDPGSRAGATRFRGPRARAHAPAGAAGSTPRWLARPAVRLGRRNSCGWTGRRRRSRPRLGPPSAGGRPAHSVVAAGPPGGGPGGDRRVCWVRARGGGPAGRSRGGSGGAACRQRDETG